MGLGYATPFLDEPLKSARRALAVSPAAQGVEIWPSGARNLAVLADEVVEVAALPEAHHGDGAEEPQRQAGSQIAGEPAREKPLRTAS